VNNITVLEMQMNIIYALLKRLLASVNASISLQTLGLMIMISIFIFADAVQSVIAKLAPTT